MAIKLKLHNNPQLPQRTNTLAEYAELAGGPSAIVWKVQDSTNPRWIGKVFDKLLLKPCLRRALLNISVDWKYFQFVVLKTTDDSFSGQQLGIFRLEGYRRNKQIIPSWFFVILCFFSRPPLNLILISSWIGVWIINCWHWTLGVNHEEPCEDQSWQFRHQHNSQHPHASVTVWWIVTQSCDTWQHL